MEEFEIIIDNTKCVANASQTILEVAKANAITIPTLCYLKGINTPASCRVCVVEVEGMRNLVTSCSTKVRANMVVHTNNARVLKARKTAVELLLSNHNKNCLSCAKNTHCELQKLSEIFSCDDTYYDGSKTNSHIDDTNGSIVRDISKCILCGKCVSVCANVQSVHAIGKNYRGFNTHIGCAYDDNMQESKCVGCGQCVLVCPTGALMQKNDLDKVINYLNDDKVMTVVQVAPAVRVAVADEFERELGVFAEGKMVTALKRIGFDKVFDVNNGADFTVIEEGKELIERIKDNKKLPMFSSCCPAWYDYIQKNYPEYEKSLSTCGSPNEMLGALVKYYYKNYEKVEKEIKIVSVMPCTAKKREIKKQGVVDASITTRELVELIKKSNINFNQLNESKFDTPFGEYSGGALIFGVTGGVTEAVLRMAKEILTGVELKKEENIFNEVRNSKGIKEADVQIADLTLKICIVNGLSNAKTVLDDIITGKRFYHFVEVMACPSGCINGGGQPCVDYNETELEEVIKKRAKALYENDDKMTLRASHKNIEVKEIYKNVLKDDPHLIHKLLHIRED